MNAPEKDMGPQPIYLKDYTVPAFLVRAVSLDFSLEPEKTRVTSILDLEPNPESKATGESLELDGELMELISIELDGSVLDEDAYVLSDSRLLIKNVPSQAFTLKIETYCNPEANKSLSGLYRSRSIYCTQCEAEGFRRITYYPDRPDVLSVFNVRIEADKKDVPILLSNGNLVENGELEGGRHFARWSDPHPKPAYLFALVGGDLARVEDTFTTMTGREVVLHIYVEPGKEDRCEWAMDSLKRSMKWDEERFEREYDLDIFMIVAVSDFNMGAMENKGLNVFNDKLILARPDTATDDDYERIEAVIAHEYFHNWTGNRITCRDWFQLCLKEGLTVFRDQEFSADERSRTVKRIDDVRMLKAYQFPEDGGPLAHPVRPASFIEINNFYTATVYEKGAELCRMIHTLLGRDGFKKGLDLYFDRHDGEAATVEQFVQCFAESSGENFDHFMKWYGQSGTPELVCSFAYDEAAKEAHLEVQQINPATPDQAEKEPLLIPLAFGLLDESGADLPLKLAEGEMAAQGVLKVDRPKQTFKFKNIANAPVPSYLRSFSSPVNLTANESDDDLVFLAAHDSDLFNRWRSLQTLALRQLLTAEQGDIIAGAKVLADCLKKTLQDTSLEPAYKALFMALPGEAEIARALKQDVDTDVVHQTRENLLTAISKHLHDELRDVYTDQKVEASYVPDARQNGMRSLRNSALGLLSKSGDPADIALAVDQYAASTNMTDKMASMRVLSHHKGPDRENIFASFYEDWKNDHLVIDKWFSLQAMSSLPGTVEQVKSLMQNELFDMKNPNKVRALIGAFAGGNPVNFNKSDGSGYKLVGDAILELDKFNPQIAARMLGVFKNWKLYENVRQKAMLDVLKNISEQELSTDTYEIATKTLAI